jgi:aspartyl-tRNA(Asn)/glutamyl-tRNA(Gln) amidotransferase subunit B
VTEFHSILEQYPNYEVTIGIEIHIQLLTNSKIFCSSPNGITEEPNVCICPVCCGHPGVLPVLNKEVVDAAIKVGLATECTINKSSVFARKHYFYPDLPKNYQITQAEHPLCSNGFVTIQTQEGHSKKIRLMRIHIEEDAGKSIHIQQSNESLVNLNRAGTPLLEIVTQPDISSTYEARTYLKELRSLVMHLGICSGNMEEGAFRADTNVSVRKKGAQQLGTRCELKNINSFKFISDAIEYEIERHISLLENGKSIIQETRLWDTKKHKTFVMRTKEEAADYRYFPDPDLPIITLSDEWIDSIRSRLPELPYQKLQRYITHHGLSPYEAEILINDQQIAHYYEQAFNLTKSKNLINWILRDVMGFIKEHKLSISQLKVTPKHLADLIDLLDRAVINNRSAQKLFLEIAQTGSDPLNLVKEQGLEQLGSSAQLEELIKTLIATHPQQVASYQAGQERIFGFFVGQIMQKTHGKGNPHIIQELLKKYLTIHKT